MSFRLAPLRLHPEQAVQRSVKNAGSTLTHLSTLRPAQDNAASGCYLLHVQDSHPELVEG